MSDRLKQLMEERQKALGEMRAITDKASAEKRDMTAEEDVQFNKLFDEQDKRNKAITTEQRKLELARMEAEQDGNRAQQERGKPDAKTGPHGTEEYRAAFNRFLQVGVSGLNGDEQRALSVGVGSQGGFTVVPEQMADSLIKFMDDMMVIRNLATKLRVPTAASLGVLSLDTDPADADWTSELAVGNEDTSMAFGKRKMIPNPLAKYIKVSNDLLRASQGGATALNIEQFVRDRLAYKFGISNEKAFLLGTGASQPLGLFVASADGVPTSRDYSTGNTSTAITMDNLIGARYTVKDQYRPRARWLFHRDAVAMIAKLKDSQNRYLWQPSQQLGQPDQLLGSPVVSSEYVPNTFTTGLYVGMFADFSFYWIVDAMAMELQRLVELFALTNQTALIGRQFTDGQPVLAEAFTRIKLG